MNHEPILDELRHYLASQFDVDAPPDRQPAPPESLVARLFARQLALNPAAARFLASTRRLPDSIRCLAEIPAIPVAAYKEMELTTVPPAERVAEFRSSGTTGHNYSRHFHSAATLEIYRLALAAWFRRRMLGDLPSPPASGPESPDSRTLRFLSFTPSPADAPHSSLAFMIGSLVDRYGAPGSTFAGRAGTDGWRVDLPAALAALEGAMQENRPIALFGTAFNFVHLLDGLADRRETFRLPPGSRAMETGGYKGRSRSVPRGELHAAIAAQLGIVPDRVASEYGMSELSSQAYDVDWGGRDARGDVGPRRFQFPPWCATSVISPETGRPAAAGEPGLLRIVDLANVSSVLAIQTEDLAIQHPDGIELLGRAPGAEARGCSLLPS